MRFHRKHKKNQYSQQFLWSFEHKSAETKIDSFDHKCLSNPLDRNMINWLYQNTNKRASSRPNPIHNCHCFHRVPMVWCCTRSITNLLKIYYVQQKAGQLQKSEKKQQKKQCVIMFRAELMIITLSIAFIDSMRILIWLQNSVQWWQSVNSFESLLKPCLFLYTVCQIERKVEAIESTTTTTKGYGAIL